jgi:hypothetical protein
LNERLLRERGRAQTERELRRIVRSVRFELLEDEAAFRILGPDTRYHGIDPHLPETLRGFGPGMGLDDVGSYRSCLKTFDLCFEDSWSGYFITGRRRSEGRGDWVLVHLDDHTDMMSTLLVESGGGLTDAATGKTFDPAVREDWESAIVSGCVGIGSFITPFFYSDNRVHVRHLNNSPTAASNLERVTREPCRYDLIPGKQFAAIGKHRSSAGDCAGTYLAGGSAERVLASLPRERSIVHIDLDYFINDFNGNPLTGDFLPDPGSRNEARLKMERFFAALHAAASQVDGWIVATSPGFCSAYHWRWLLNELEERIEEFQAR